MAGTWTCQRQSEGRKCGQVNPARKRKCEWCGKLRPPRKKAAHMAALKLPYEAFLEANGGKDVCGICGKPPSAKRRLDRDHDHSDDTGRPRGLLCHRHNRGLDWFNDDPEELRLAIGYLERTR